MSPTLKDIIAWDLAQRYLDSAQYDDAVLVANGVVQQSELPFVRDCARRLLARIESERGNYDKALQTCDQTEWPQSAAWKDVERTFYLAMAGRTEDAISALKKTVKDERYYDYLRSLQDLVEGALAKGKLDIAKAMLAGFNVYPASVWARCAKLDTARALRNAKRYEEAVAILKENDATDSLVRGSN